MSELAARCFKNDLPGQLSYIAWACATPCPVLMHRSHRSDYNGSFEDSSGGQRQADAFLVSAYKPSVQCMVLTSHLVVPGCRAAILAQLGGRQQPLILISHSR